MKKVLVTGGAGFVGSNLVKRLITGYGCEVTVLDDFFTGDTANLSGCAVEVIKGCVTDTEMMGKVTQGKDVIFHLAARNIIVSTTKPREDMNVNVIGTFNVLEAAKLNRVPRVVYTSTSSIYGNPRYLPINEDELPKFLNFYSVSKFAGESYAKTFYELYDLPVTVVRYSNVYGPNQSPRNPYCGVIGKFIAAALKGESLNIHGDGEQTRDYTYVDDACEATILAALSPKAIGEVYNIGTGVETSVNRLAQHIVKLSESLSEIEYIDKRDIDNIRRRVLNIEKIRNHLKFSPTCTLAKGLKATIEGFVS